MLVARIENDGTFKIKGNVVIELDGIDIDNMIDIDGPRDVDHMLDIDADINLFFEYLFGIRSVSGLPVDFISLEKDGTLFTNEILAGNNEVEFTTGNKIKVNTLKENQNIV